MNKVLKNSGLKVTKIRTKVIDILEESTKPLNAYEIHHTVNLESKINISTIYRVLDKFFESGIIHKIEKLNAYIVCSKPKQSCKCHHLFVCNLCNKVIEFIDHSICKIQDQLALKNNFKTNSHWLEMIWVCNQCNN